MQTKNYLLLFLVTLVFSFCQHHQVVKERTILIFSEAGSIDSYQGLMTGAKQYAEKNQFALIVSEDRKYLTEDSLKNISVAIILSDPGEFSVNEQRALERYVQSGGGMALLETEINKYLWPWYHLLVDKLINSPETESPDSRILLLNQQSQPSGSASEQAIDHLVGDNTWDQSKIVLSEAPDINRFTFLVLDDNINEPMELSILPSGKVLFIEREGKIKIYNPKSGQTKVVATLDVHTMGNYEDGLLGLTIDPHYELNNWIYLYYSPAGEKSVQNVSRFRLAYEDSLIVSTEKLIIEIPVQRETCCHSAGSLVFGPGGLLFISTGDNTSSKESDGFSPLDERPGRAPFDAQKSSGNTHDLRGKILRIEVQPDGSYKIPEGNLFSKDGFFGSPEIYVMGCRNPFRFSVDARTGYLYWGDVGPDGGKDGPQGPQSYDEWNQARKPGNFGWPYFVADNKAYSRFDFTTGEVGAPYDPAHPVNASPNNYGSRELPPAQPAMIWYEYGKSDTWPMLGSGSRSSMAGPVYYKTAKNSPVAFPDYFNGKLFIYEWARSWMKVASFDDQGNLNKIEPFLPEIEVSKPIDMEFGPDGAMYVLAYGANYFANNEDAQLIKIEYAAGNRVPIPNIVASKTVGPLPLEVTFNASASFDYDFEDSLSYRWTINDSIYLQNEVINFTFNHPGVNQIDLWAIDSKGDSASTRIIVRSGNSRPEITIDFQGNQSFYFDGQSRSYQVGVKDLEDGSTPNEIQGSAVVINFNYLPQGADLANLGADLFKKHTNFLVGRNLIDASDCATCHDYQIVSRGPSYQAIADHYYSFTESTNMLAQKIILGGSGNWGNTMMAAHPQHSVEEAEQMVSYILSLSSEAEKGGLPLFGSLATTKHLAGSTRGKYLFTVYYEDNGAPGTTSLSAHQTMVLGDPKVQSEAYHDFLAVSRQRPSGGALEYVDPHQTGAYIVFNDIDVGNIGRLTFRARSRNSGIITAHLDHPEGPIWSQLQLNNSAEWYETGIQVNKYSGKHDLYFVFEAVDEPDRPGIHLDWIRFESSIGAGM